MNMKQAISIVGGGTLLSLGMLFFCADCLQAQTTNQVIITATATVQNPSSNDNGTVTTTPAPTSLALSTKQILSFLAVDESSEGNYAQTNFPAGAKLMLLPDTGSGPDFQVWGKTNNLLVDVSDLLTLTNGGDYGSLITSGKINDANSLPSPATTNQQIVTIDYDDSSAGGNLQFYISGTGKDITDYTVIRPSAGTYKETESNSATGMSGDGNYTDTNGNVNPLVVTGSFAASGSGTFSQ